MQPVLSAVRDAERRNDGAGASLEDVASSFLENVQNQPYLVVRKTDDRDGESTSEIKRPGELFRADKKTLKRECVLSLLEQVTAPLRARNNLVGLGLACVAADWNGDQREGLPQRLPELFSYGVDSAWNALQALINIVVRRRAIIFPEGIQLSHLMQQGPKLFTYHLSCADRLEGRQQFRWNSYVALKQKDRVIRRSPQVEVVARLIGKDKIRNGDEVAALLEKIWLAFRDLRVLESEYPNEYQFPADHLVLYSSKEWHSCRRCGVLTPFAVKGVCTIAGCGGRLDSIGPGERLARLANHHWFHRYTQVNTLPLRVKEHTAQLTNDVGRDYQRNFIAGDVNVLSSSTTFELGVDVGQLKTVMLRNVPPTPANYIQRAGRAGRRMGGFRMRSNLLSFHTTRSSPLPHS